MNRSAIGADVGGSCMIEAAVRHPLLRVLLALIFGLWSPMCCCRAMAMAGMPCGGAGETESAAVDGCCDESSDRSPAGEEPGSCPGDSAPGHDGCPSCPSCQGAPGVSAGAGIKIDAGLEAAVQEWTPQPCVVWALLRREAGWLVSAGPARPPWRGVMPHVKANRDAQRWHCALTT
jgi:hypothetical protein